MEKLKQNVLRWAFMICLVLGSALLCRCDTDGCEILHDDLSSHELRQFCLDGNDITAIFYYYEWSPDVINSYDSYRQLSQDLCRQVQFLAVDCQKEQNCPIVSHETTFPLILIYHRLKKNPIRYNGPIKVDYLRQFFHKLMYPIKYITSTQSFNDLVVSRQFSAAAFIPASNERQIRAYQRIALQNLEQYPSRNVDFGIITSYPLAETLDLRIMQIHVFDQIVSKTEAVETHNVMAMADTGNKQHFKFQQPNEWVLGKHFIAGVKSNFLYKALTGGNASFLAFISNNEQLRAIESVAMNYNRNMTSANNSSCCFSTLTSRDEPCENCLVSSPQPSCLQLLSQSVTNWPRSSSSFHVNNPSDYSHIRTELNCDFKTSIHGLKQRTNKTLTFAAFDIGLHGSICENLGICNVSSGAVIVDVNNEDEYLLLKELTEESIAEHVFRYSVNQLQSTRSTDNNCSLPHPSPVGCDERVAKSSLTSSEDFQVTALNTTHDVLLFYTAPWCASCMIYKHYVDDLRRMMSQAKHLQIIDVDDGVNSRLQWPFYVDTFPSLILFPSKKSADSARFPSAQKAPSLKSLFTFLLDHGSSEMKVEVMTILCRSARKDQSDVIEKCSRMFPKMYA